MYRQLKNIFLTIFIFITNSLLGQDSLQVSNTNSRLSESQLLVGENYVIDTIIDGQAYFKKQIKAIEPLTEKKELQDDTYASQIDKKWLEELYSNSLFDTIYKTVRELDYKTDVYYPELPTDTLKARLAEINARTPFNVEYNPGLERIIKSFLKNRRQSLERLIGLSHYYFPMFESELDAQNIPLEIKYLAIVESALKPRARSRVGATGLWQFMFATGKQYGLDVSSYVDERRDPVKATKSAAKYLSRLYEIFGDWDLALAAYNSGPGNVSKAIRRSGGYKNYWNLRSYLPRETAGYVPLFLATMYVFEYAEEHDLAPTKPLFNYIETDTIQVKEMISLDQVSEITGVKMEALQFLNPSYKLDIIPKVKGKNYALRLPKEALGIFVNNEDKIYAFAKTEFNKREKPLPQFLSSDTKIRYRVKSGDYLGKIARRYGVRVSQLKKWNGLRSNNLRIGQRLTIYPRKPIATKKTNSKTVVKTNGKQTYKVRQGDSLWSIAQKFSGVSVQNIKEWNGISGNKLTTGTLLIISQ
jgi:membrane-bound lytic murein transglycosylase D